MTPLFLLFWGSFILGLSGAVMPGPVLTATIGEVTRRGFAAGPLIVIGHGALEIALLAGLIMGLGAWLKQDVILGLLGVAGGCILVGLGVHAMRSVDSIAPPDRRVQAPNDRSIHGPVLAGMLTTLSNPYWYLWWATVGLSFAAESLVYGTAGLASFFTGHIAADLAWYCLIAVGVAHGRRLLSAKAYRGILTACGTVLVGIGVLFVALGVGHLRAYGA